MAKVIHDTTPGRRRIESILGHKSEGKDGEPPMRKPLYPEGSEAV
jgi:hypothetical protein